MGECVLILFNHHMATVAFVEVWLHDEVSAIGQLGVTPDSTKISVHGEDCLRPILREEGVAVVARLVQEVQGGAHEGHSGVVQAVNVNLEQVTGHHCLLLTQVKCGIAMVKDWSEELCRGVMKHPSEEQQ